MKATKHTEYSHSSCRWEWRVGVGVRACKYELEYQTLFMICLYNCKDPENWIIMTTTHRIQEDHVERGREGHRWCSSALRRIRQLMKWKNRLHKSDILNNYIKKEHIQLILKLYKVLYLIYLLKSHLKRFQHLIEIYYDISWFTPPLK